MPAKKIAPPKPLSAHDGDVVLLVGTMKGLFLFGSSAARRSWRRTGPFFPGTAVYAAVLDTRGGRRRIWAAPTSWHWGAELAYTDDLGRKWTQPETPLVRFPESSGGTLKNIWQIAPGRADEPDTIYCGVEPSALFSSRDGGASWSLNEGLWNHPHREKWNPGFGGLCLHTVLLDPSMPGRITVASSTGGVYRSDDGGATWRARNQGVRAEFMPDPYPEFGQCVHKIAHHPSVPGRLYLQNHWGLYRSDDGGDTWKDVANGVPSDFGFCMATHPTDPDTAYIVPLHADMFRCTPEGKLRVYRTRDGGRSWKPTTRGLPQKDAWETVVRDAMGVDSLDPAGVYFGTRTGRLYGSRDDGGSFALIADGLPPIVCVRAAVLGRTAKSRPAAPRAKTPRRASAKTARPKPRTSKAKRRRAA
ncbi:MAG TPA: exo-alpha-sialidase [Thermoanaerobaculia bacterium]|jgi:photosystem II stability/assembly factor-like uncharacterized protein|nr:exo-alpha-sialidase [Thermoanaerobaculia bacterium]